MSWCLKGANAVTQASDAARAFGEAQWLSEGELARLSIVVEELVANLYDHGGVGSEDEVRLELTSEPAGLRIVIVDFGTPFDSRQPPKKGGRPERGGGAGIEIVQAWAHLVDYEVTDRGNRLELILPVPD